MMPNALPPAEFLREALSYDPETGDLRWKERPVSHFPKDPNKTPCWNGQYAGKPAGHKNQAGYWRVHLDGRHHVFQRVIWKLMTGENPDKTIDHIDGDPGNNRWANLRLATFAQQKHNSSVRADCLTRLRGAHRVGKKWQAYIRGGGVFRHLGMFNTPQEANAAYEAAAREVHGAFYRAT